MAFVASVFVATASAQPQQTYPNRPIRLIAPYGTGGGTDNAGRLLSQKLADAFGQQVVMDNRPGAGGIIGAELAAKASPDGYTLIMVSAAHTMLPSLHKKLPYDIIKDFTPVSLLVAYPFLLVVHPSMPATLKELIALAKAKPGQFNYASGGNGSGAHLAAELFKSMAGVNLVHVPYKGGAGTAVIGLIAGETSVAFYSVSATLPQVKAGRLRALAITGKKRSQLLPDLPTVAEAGVPGYEVITWTGMVAPTGTPKSIVKKLHGRLTRVLQLQEVKERLAAIGFEPVGNTPEEFGTIIQKEVLKWAKVVKESGAELD